MTLYTQNSNVEPATATAPTIDLIDDIYTVDKTLPTTAEYAKSFSEKFPNIGKKTIDDLMNILVNIKRDKAKLSHKERIQIFVKLFECDEETAQNYYKFCKLIYKFQNIKKVFTHILKYVA